ncbi:hypothetical protein FH603_3337 [Spirosoma sp. LMG 31447]|uniref:Uncharacterized protein n=1 Tax=Spirosoma utsteinense TaxID=2585773 RepID=A0ABR6W9I1_9BACT|nr:hypothetical protein [Spirosoma utsteinense]
MGGRVAVSWTATSGRQKDYHPDVAVQDTPGLSYTQEQVN